MPSFRDGTANLLGLTSPGVYVDQILPTAFIAGLPTNVEAMIGVGSWGPVNAVTAFSDPTSCPYGPPQNRLYDIAKHVSVACQQGSVINFRGVRVTDGTDVAATGMVVGTGGGTFTAKYTGTLGNQITITFQPTAAIGAYACIVNFPGRTPERFDNIGGTGAAFWQNLATAINVGTSQRGPSNYVVFTASTMTAAPTVNTALALTGGTDGATTITSSVLLGQQATLPRTGMYALAGLRADASGYPDTFQLCDCTDTSIWNAMLSFAIQNAMMAVVTLPSGGSISSAVASRVSVAIDDPSIKIIAGDWPTVYVPGLGSILASPATVYQGLVGNLSPEQSPINKALIAVSATQTSQTGVLTSDAEESIAQTGGIDFIGRSSALNQDFFSFMTGRNASSNTAANGDEYTRLTNSIIRGLEGAATRSIVGRLQSVRPDDPTRLQAAAVLNSYFADLANPDFGSGGYGQIDNWAVTCDLTNNTPSTIARGFLFAFCAVRYLATVRFFVIKLAGGNNVTVSVQNTAPTISTSLQLAA
ncbi:hypothetical protein MKK88_01155 [Methylobacterium sp. E-005]|uniref:hypothetical protein n=1 Tax=Methylobacterium sp. E-005 TaxID=2836549 RepID=UPI001FBA6EB1|nr:hypothetical protein [Methylobacterium sp. E-005]MCJ2084604.1 hypothetical protein [Methylobacterium sp. E-005]